MALILIEPNDDTLDVTSYRAVALQRGSCMYGRTMNENVGSIDLVAVLPGGLLELHPSDVPASTCATCDPTSEVTV